VAVVIAWFIDDRCTLRLHHKNIQVRVCQTQHITNKREQICLLEAKNSVKYVARECVTAENRYEINQKLLNCLAAPTPFSIRRSYSQIFMPYCFKIILWYQRSSSDDPSSSIHKCHRLLILCSQMCGWRTHTVELVHCLGGPLVQFGSS